MFSPIKPNLECLCLSLAPQPSLGLGLLLKIRLNFLEASQQFSFLQGGDVSPTPNPHPGGPGLCIYIPVPHCICIMAPKTCIPVKIHITSVYLLTSVSIAIDYGLDDRMIGVRIPAGAGNFSLRHHVQTGSGAHPASYLMRTGGSLPGGKAAGTWSWPLTSIQCRGQIMRGAIPPLL
jgi:hypothetical protein